jgi:hypothetical protein
MLDANQEGYFWQLGGVAHVWGLSPNQYAHCHDLSFGFTTKTNAWKGVG